MSLKQQILILGAGESGVGAALLAQKLGYDVFVSDSSAIKISFKKELEENHIAFEEGKHSKEQLIFCNLIIKSPGIPNNAPILQQALELGKEIISEIEFASRFTTARTVCVTGSNGKTTTTALIGHILIETGLDVCVCGNIGRSFARELAKSDHDIFVIELSSFQLEHMVKFRANVAVLLNITPDHLERYNNSIEEYARTKFRITQNQTVSDMFVYNADDTIIKKLLPTSYGQAKQYGFSLLSELKEGAYADNENIYLNIDNHTTTMNIEALALQGKHNVYNSMAAAVATHMFDSRKDALKKSFQTFQKIEHRLEFVAKVHGISFYNDSKATNVNSVWYALESMKSPIIWIAGGVDKGNDYNALLPLVKEKVKALICLGTDNTKLMNAFTPHLEIIMETTSMMDAVNAAYRIGNPNDIVLLSPACASFDLFENFEDRGIQYKNAIREL